MDAESSPAQDPVLTPTSPASPSLARGQGEISQKEETVHGSDELSQNQKEEAVLGSDELSQKEEAVLGSDELCQKEEAAEEEGAPATAGECEDLPAKEELEWYNSEGLHGGLHADPAPSLGDGGAPPKFLRPTRAPHLEMQSGGDGVQNWREQMRELRLWRGEVAACLSTSRRRLEEAMGMPRRKHGGQQRGQ